MLAKLPDAVGEVLSEVRAGLTSSVHHAVDLRQGLGSPVLPAEPTLPMGRNALLLALVLALQQRGVASGCLVGTCERPSTRMAEPLDAASSSAGRWTAA
jgi:hypothetical protein